MKIFKINKSIEIVCNAESTRSGFRHLATLFVDGVETTDGKCTYQNRTWESYEFQSVLFNVVNKSSLSDKDMKLCKKFIEDYKEHDTIMATTAMVASLGEVFADGKEEKNKWKKRMIKAGLGNRGISFPEDWDELSEDDKEARLDNTIKFMKDKTDGDGKDGKGL